MTGGAGRRLAALLLALGIAVSVASMGTINATMDEVQHIPAGYSYWLKDDFRLNTEHPPLVKELAALPLLPLKLRFDSNDPSWHRSLAFEFGPRFLCSWNMGQQERIVWLARLPVIALFALFGILLFRAAAELYGAAGGVVVLLLYLATPELLAHGQLVTTDLAVAGFSFAAVWFFRGALIDFRWPRVLLCAAACACAAASKFSSLLLGPILLGLGACWVYSGEGGDGLTTAPGWRERLRRVALLGLSAHLLSWCLLWACYGFRYAIAPDVEILVPWEAYDSHSLLNRAVLLLRDWRLLPEAYLAGLLECTSNLGGRPAYLMGRISQSGWWYYFPVSLLLKTPLPLLALGAAGVPLLRKSGRLTTLALLLPPVVFLLVAMAGPVNIGNRHILPVYPYLIVWGGATATAALQSRRVWARGAVLALLVWLLFGTVRVYPHFLSYFNELVGGPEQGWRYLVDSNVDWGQDLKGLAEYRRQHGGEKIYVCYFGNIDPRCLIPDARILPGLFRPTDGFQDVPRGALVAVSVTHLAGMFLEKAPGGEPFFRELRGLQPVARIGYSIHIYRRP